MTKKIRVGIIFGGRSAEHEVSLQSAKNVVDALDKSKYDVVLIGIQKDGRWTRLSPSAWLQNEEDPKRIEFGKTVDLFSLVPGDFSRHLLGVEQPQHSEKLDVVFPVLHGPLGEDGTVQGLLKLLDIPFIGPGVLGSAVGMDKDVMKRLLRDAKIPIAKFSTFDRSNSDEINFEALKAQLGSPMFIKPANMGSSVGISKAHDVDEFQKAVEEAFLYDTKIVVEEAIKGREIECSVLGNELPIASLPGEIIPHHEFYSYDAKYLDEKGASIETPARLSSEVITRVQRLAIKTFRVLCCEGMARVDFFLKENGELLVNEINTIPGFTKISQYPRMWEATGIPYSELLDRLIQLALERHERDRMLRMSK